jgi:murein DD-endopeptidase MepM/ murein hydrolase activator NlpD
MFRRKISILVAPHGGGGGWSVVVPLPLAVGAALLFAVLIAGGFVGALVGWDGLARGRENAHLAREVARLEEEVRRIGVLDRELVELREFETRVRRWAGIGNAEYLPDTREPGAAPGWEAEDRLLAEIPLFPPVTGWVSRGFEPGLDGHAGLDFPGETGDPVRASAPGVVRSARWDDTFGEVVVLDHGNGLTSTYGHNDTLLVEVGDLVSAGEELARLGSTGRSSAPHLHFEVRAGEQPLDPRRLLASVW